MVTNFHFDKYAASWHTFKPWEFLNVWSCSKEFKSWPYAISKNDLFSSMTAMKMGLLSILLGEMYFISAPKSIKSWIASTF